MKVTLGFSPCPNDTFIFDALVNHKIDTIPVYNMYDPSLLSRSLIISIYECKQQGMYLSDIDLINRSPYLKRLVARSVK